MSASVSFGRSGFSGGLGSGRARRRGAESAVIARLVAAAFGLLARSSHLRLACYTMYIHP
jgi:hypothetical protein